MEGTLEWRADGRYQRFDDERETKSGVTVLGGESLVIVICTLSGMRICK